MFGSQIPFSGSAGIDAMQQSLLAFLPRLGLFLALFLIISCQKEVERPTINPDKLVQILTDIHIAEAAMNNLYGAPKDSLAKLYYQQIYTIHGVDSAELTQDLALLKKNPVYMDSLYEKVVDNIMEKNKEKDKKKK